MLRLLLVDDQPLFREGLRVVLSADPQLQVVAEAGNGEEALKQAEQHRPDVALMDLNMPVMNGVVATRRLKVQQPGLKVLVLTTFDDDRWLFEALRAGAVGYLLKDASAERLKEAVQAAGRGESFLDPAVAAKVLTELSRLQAMKPADETLRRPDPFTPREREVLGLLLKGAANKEIAAALFLSEGTVKNHVTSILLKLEVGDRAAAAEKAKALGWG